MGLKLYDSLCFFKHIRSKLILITFIGVLSLIVSSCGFTLKGKNTSGSSVLSSPSRLPFNTLVLQTDDFNTSLIQELQHILQFQGVTLIDNKQHRQNSLINLDVLPRLVFSQAIQNKQVLSTTTTGRVKEYRLYHALTVQLFDKEGRAWLEPRTFSYNRDYSYNDNQVLAKQLEEHALYQAMDNDLVIDVMHYLNTAYTQMPVNSVISVVP